MTIAKEDIKDGFYWARWGDHLGLDPRGIDETYD
jgi:hypothetical protein